MLTIENRPIGRLIPYVRNARTHSEAQNAQIAGSIADFGFVNPALIGPDDLADLSTMDEAAFFKAQAAVIAAAARLKEHRFAVWVVGDVRESGGFYVNLPGRTVEAFEAAGARFYNEAILVTAVGSLPIRTGRQFTAARKLSRTHQSVLVFVKGDPRRATEACGEVAFGEIETETETNQEELA